MSASDLQNQVRDFLIQKTGAGGIGPDEDRALMGAGLLDSFGLVTLLAEVEARFGVFPDLMVHDPGDYSTLNGLTNIILQNLGVAPVSTQAKQPSHASSPVHARPDLVRIERLHAAHPLWAALPPLFKQMFDDFASTGLRLPLVDGGEHLWLKSIEGLPDNVFFVAGAVRDDALQGFITARMKLLPAYLGGQHVGEVAHLCVRPAARRHGVATGLASAATAWCRDRGAASVELQVLSHNAGALAFWRQQGFEPELIQLRRNRGDASF
ncbi:MAG: GNAT family N-acetyltransferase [Verrucomicrobiaceae bacterium]|nr:GNAT family N-acetyltransferase [Verrucomicrobiaceae bacterium]